MKYFYHDRAVKNPVGGGGATFTVPSGLEFKNDTFNGRIWKSPRKGTYYYQTDHVHQLISYGTYRNRSCISAVALVCICHRSHMDIGWNLTNSIQGILAI